MSLNVEYPKILDLFRKLLISGRTESHAFLVWFLQNYYRLDEVEAQDTVCDGPDDKGVDGIYVNENLESIDVFQCKIVQNPDKTLGDTKLKEFYGTLAQFENPAGIIEIASSTGNIELKNLLNSNNVAKKVEDGFIVRGIFITNIGRDQSAIDFIKQRGDNFRVFDKQELQNSYVPIGQRASIETPVEFDVFGFDCAQYQIDDAKVILGPLKGNELLTLDGIASGKLFAWNVRSSLGRTKVNKDIGNSINDSSEHKNFLLYHNGLTILCSNLEKQEDKIKISGYSVVNGCQSLTSLNDNRTKVTDDLRILTRLIQLPPEHELAEKITHHSNNQNPINARDLQSNSNIQRRLQTEFKEIYSDEIFYRIKRGEQDHAPQVIDNDLAGRLLLAFDLKQPWTCHQTYKLFDELHSEIFARPEVNAQRIVAIHDIYQGIKESIDEIEYSLFANYTLTQFFLLYLIREALECDDVGKQFCAEPNIFISEANGRTRLLTSIKRVLKDIIIDINAEVRERNESKNPLDYKRELKSPSPIKELTRNIIPPYQKAVSRGRATSFGSEWESTA